MGWLKPSFALPGRGEWQLAHSLHQAAAEQSAGVPFSVSVCPAVLAAVSMGLHRPALETWQKSSCLQRCGFPWQGEEGGKMQEEEGNRGEGVPKPVLFGYG